MSKGSSFFNLIVVKDFDLGYLVMVKFSLIFLKNGLFMSIVIQ